MTEPNDRELEQYLKGDSAVSRKYREASGESTPPALDDAVLAKARAELRRKPGGASRWLSGLALAASVVLGVNLGWNVYQAEPVPAEVPQLQKATESHDAFVPEPPAAAPAPQAAPELKLEERLADRTELREREAPAEAQRKRTRDDRAAMAAQREAESARQDTMLRSAEPAGATAMAPAAPLPPLSELAKIDHLIGYASGLPGATFIRGGKEYSAGEAAKHLRLEREQAGDRVHTADDFIRLCVSHAQGSGEAYLIRFADGRTRTAEDVLREELARIEGR